jgi:Prokaryotic membrane lipoprotein lipid attachment site
MRQLLLAAVAALMLTGCSSSPSPNKAPSPTPAETPATTSSLTPTAATSPVADCLNGRYRLVRFVGVGERGTFGTGEGGDVTVTFDGGSYLLRGAGKDPIELSLAGQPADLLVNGTISGGYHTDGNRGTFTVAKSTGSATLAVGWWKESVSMAQVDNALAGGAGLACTNDALIVTLQDLRLEFAKA